MQKGFLRSRKEAITILVFIQAFSVPQDACTFYFKSNRQIQKVADKYLDVLEEEIKETAQLIKEKISLYALFILEEGLPFR